VNVTYLDPSEDPADAESTLSDRPESLNGLTIGLLDNGKTNAGNLLQYIADTLSEQFDDIQFETIDKPSPFKPAPDETIQNAAVKFGAIITGIGD